MRFCRSTPTPTPQLTGTPVKITPTVALTLRAVGTGVWEGTMMAASWVNTPNPECPGGSVGFKPSTPEKPKPPEATPPTEPEVETPGASEDGPADIGEDVGGGISGGEVGGRDLESAEEGGYNVPPLSTETVSTGVSSSQPTGPASIGEDSGQGVGGGSVTSANSGALVANLPSNKSFWVWLWSLIV